MTQTQAVTGTTEKLGRLAKSYCNLILPVEVMQDSIGYFIGTQTEGLPISRESKEHFRTYQEAAHALDTGRWKQRQYPYMSESWF